MCDLWRYELSVGIPQRAGDHAAHGFVRCCWAVKGTCMHKEQYHIVASIVIALLHRHPAALSMSTLDMIGHIGCYTALTSSARMTPHLSLGACPAQR